MRLNDKCGFFDEAGSRHLATITGIPGTGASGFKTLDLTYRDEGETVEEKGVPHENDAGPGEAFWIEKGASLNPEPEPEPEKAKAKKGKKK